MDRMSLLLQPGAPRGPSALIPRGRARPARRRGRRSPRRSPRDRCARGTSGATACPTRRAERRRTYPPATRSASDPGHAPVVIGAVRVDRVGRRGDRRPRRADVGGVALAMTEEQEPRRPPPARAGPAARARARRASAGRGASPTGRRPSARCACRAIALSYCWTKSFIWMSGMRIANAMKPTRAAHEDDHERLEQARQRLHARLDLRVVRVARRSRASARAARSSRRRRSCGSRSAGSRRSA